MGITICPCCRDNLDETGTPLDGPENSDVYKDCECKHYFCVLCIEQFLRNDVMHCPICGFDWSEWILSHYPLDDDDTDDDDE